MTLEVKTSTASELTQILEKMNKDGNFLMSVVTDQNGLPIVFSSREGFDPERQSATVAMIKKTIVQNEKRLGIAQAEEINIIDSNGHLLVCRSFMANKNDLTLAVLVPDRRQTYRRITTQTINQISWLWSKRWK